MTTRMYFFAVVLMMTACLFNLLLLPDNDYDNEEARLSTHTAVPDAQFYVSDFICFHLLLVF